MTAGDASRGRLFGGIEAGGTKFICAVGTGPDDLREVIEIPTRDPASTLAEALGFFRSLAGRGQRIAGLGIGSFGPVELDPRSADYGRITTTPKPGWQGVDIRGEFARALGVPVAIDTDVNAAALGELEWGAARGLEHFLYVTVGTGVGVGAVIGGRVLHGEHHPEMGHVFVPVSADEPAGFDGCCPYHGSCIEGLASGTAIGARWGARLDAFPPGHPAWQLEAGYLAAFFANLTFILQPQRIVAGGGVMSEPLTRLVRERLHTMLAGYRPTLADREAVDDYVVMPGLGGRAGILGAIELALRASGRDAGA